MTRFVIFCVLVSFTAVLTAQDPVATDLKSKDIVAKTKPALNDAPVTTLDYPLMHQGEIVYGDMAHDDSIYVAPLAGASVQGPIYQAAPHVAYGADLGTPAYRQIPNGPLYNGPTWGLFPKYHRKNKPMPTRAFHQPTHRPLRFLPAGWRR